MGTFGKTVHQSVTKIYGNPCDICQQLGEGHTSDYISTRVYKVQPSFLPKAKLLLNQL